MITWLLTSMHPKDLMVVPIHAYTHRVDSIKVEHTSSSLIARIHWCEKQQVKARTEGEREEWSAEEDGLKDALLHTDRTFEYHYRPRAVLERYATGLEDGRALIRAARVKSVWQPAI
jgi:hypothetical protein